MNEMLAMNNYSNLSETSDANTEPPNNIVPLWKNAPPPEEIAEHVYEQSFEETQAPELSPQEQSVEPYATVIVRLLSSEIYENEKIWESLLEHRIPVMDYFARIGLEVIIDQREGFAFLKQIELDDTGRTVGLVKRTSLSYEVTLLLVLLREVLEDYELQDTTSPACFVSHQKIRDELGLFFRESANKVKLLKQLDRYIRQVMDLGFLKLVNDVPQPEDRLYEIRRILKAKVGGDVLEDIRRTLERHVEH